MVLTGYVTEKIGDIRYVSVLDDGVPKKKLFLQPTDSEERFEIDFSAGVDIESLAAVLDDTFVATAVPAAITANHVFSGAPWYRPPSAGQPNLQFLDVLGAASGAIRAPGGANFSLGAGGLSSLTTGQYNTTVGQDALRDVDTGFLNTAIGTNALQLVTSGFHNTAIGANALRSLDGVPGALPGTEATNNTAIGANAGEQLTVGHRNTAIGVDALFLETTGDYNTAVGVHALNSQVGVSGSVAVGYYALFSNVVGEDNTAVGRQALGDATVGQLTSVGAYAAGSVTTGAFTTAFGYQALFAPGTNFANRTITGGYQTAVGALTGQKTDTQNFYGTAIGYSALYGGTGGVAIGALAEANHDRAVAIGMQSVSTADYQVEFGPRHIELTEVASFPAAGAANSVRFGARDNGSGKTQFCVQFGSGAVQVLATEP